MKIGSKYFGEGRCTFSVWAPFMKEINIEILSGKRRSIEMPPDGNGYWHADVEWIEHLTKYRYKLNNDKSLSDPASNFQPDGIHGPSAVYNHDMFSWDDTGWNGITPKDLETL